VLGAAKPVSQSRARAIKFVNPVGTDYRSLGSIEAYVKLQLVEDMMGLAAFI
jgi:hypothetical protein